MSLSALPPLPAVNAGDGLDFTAIIQTARPVILRGLVAHWPTVHMDAQDLLQLFLQHDSGAPVDAILLAPQEQGRVFYNPAMDGFNFARKRVTLSQVLEMLVRYSHFAQAPSVAVQSAPLADCLPGLRVSHNLSLPLPATCTPRIWVGNQVVTPAHFDESRNIACVVAGRRRFTLLPPDQVRNLYIGPLDFAPTATPISLVNFRQPDYAQHPRFAQALAQAQIAELEPGDALYIPPLWWHHVESLDLFNVLVNYWWQDGDQVNAPSPFVALCHCMQELEHLSPELKQAWRAMFDHYVFGVD